MKMHANARLSLKGRELLIDRVENAGWSLVAAAEAAGISDRTARKWITRHRAEGRDGLLGDSACMRVRQRGRFPGAGSAGFHCFARSFGWLLSRQPCANAHSLAISVS